MRALFIGRFQPLHLGHLHAIQKIVEKYGFVTIAVGSSNSSRSKENPFSFTQRKQMLEATLNAEGLRGKYAIIPLPDHESDSKWVASLRKRLHFELVVTGNQWVSRCLKSHAVVQVPKYLRRAELQATHVRKLMAEGKGWQALVPKQVQQILEKTGRKENAKKSKGLVL